MRKSKPEADDEFSHLPLFNADDDDDVGDFLPHEESVQAANDAAGRELAARQRVELRNEQRSLREQLSDWDDYDSDFDTEL